jgi:16S rRNA (guanine527-N7)-methyltransferase
MEAGRLKNGVIGLFPKGREAGTELTAAREEWRFEADLIPRCAAGAG